MSNGHQSWEDFSFNQASALAAYVKADDPRNRLQTFYVNIARADLVIGVWNEPDREGLFWAPIKGDPHLNYANGKVEQGRVANEYAVIPCRSFKEMMSLRILFGDGRLVETDNVPPLKRGPYHAVDVREEFVFDPIH